MRSLHVPALVAALAALVSVAPRPAHADGMIIVERPRIPPPRPIPQTVYGFPLSVRDHHVTVSIKGPVAVTTVDQTFANPHPYELEGTYVFPLPEDAAVDKFSMWIDGKETEAELLDAQKARSIYEGIVREMRDPALVEYMGRGLFRARIFPIPANGDKRVKISYAQVLGRDGGMTRYRYPLGTEKHSSTPLGKVSISVSIEEDAAIKAIYAPWQEIDIRRDGDKKARAACEASNVRIDSDFVLAFATKDADVGISALTYGRATDEEGGTCLLLLAPKVELKADEVPAKDVVFILDTSGSMTEQNRFEQARRALKYCVSRLDARDRFGIVDFSTDVRAWKGELAAASDENKASAVAYVGDLRARGGTAIEEALLTGLKMRGADANRPFQVVFLTDGEPTIGTTVPAEILKNLKTATEGKDARIFVFGVGADVNTTLLDRIAGEHHGDRDYALPGEDIEIVMSSFYDKISSPVLADLDLKLESETVRFRDTYPNPRKLPDLFRGNQISLLSRFTGEGKVTATLSGKVNGVRREFTQVLELKRDAQNVFLPRVWAQRKIGFLLDEIRLNGEKPELKDEVVRLARAFGIPTPYTSWLVVDENEMRRRRGGPAEPTNSARPMSPADDAFGRLRGEGMKKAEDKPLAGGGPAPAMSPGRAGEDEYRDGGSIQRKEKTGASAAKDAKRIAGLEKGDKDSDDARSHAAGLDRETIQKVIRQVGDRTFYAAGDAWVESTVDAEARKAAKKVSYLSDAYFELLAKNPAASACFALGSKLVIRLGTEVFEVTAE